MNHPTIVGGKLRQVQIERPSLEKIITLAASAYADGFGLSGSGPVRKVTGSTITIIVGPTGCSCPMWRNGTYCFHMAMLAVESLPVSVETRIPTPITQRRPSTRRPGRHLWPVRPVTPIRPRAVA
jgi:hypothetical protein